MPQFYKLLAIDHCHNGFTYKEGLNVDHVPFEPSGECQPGGLYFTTLEYVPRWYRKFWPLIADVTVPDDARVYAEPCGAKWKADRLVLSNIRPLREFLKTLDEDTLCQMLTEEGDMLEHVENQTEAMCLAAMQKNTFALPYVRNQTEAVCIAAVQVNCAALQNVVNQTEAVCMAAVQQSSYAIEFVHDQTEALCLAAVRRNGFSIFRVLKQTEAICLAGVNQNGMALQYVRDQTEAICRAAVAQCPGAREFVKIPIDF